MADKELMAAQERLLKKRQGQNPMENPGPLTSQQTLKNDAFDDILGIIKRCQEKQKDAMVDYTPPPPSIRVVEKRKPHFISFGIPEKYKDKTFDNFKGQKNLISGLKDCDDGLFIYGPTGVGKTHLAVAVTMAGDICDGIFYHGSRTFAYHPGVIFRKRRDERI